MDLNRNLFLNGEVSVAAGARASSINAINYYVIGAFSGNDRVAHAVALRRDGQRSRYVKINAYGAGAILACNYYGAHAINAVTIPVARTDDLIRGIPTIRIINGTVIVVVIALNAVRLSLINPSVIFRIKVHSVRAYVGSDSRKTLINGKFLLLGRIRLRLTIAPLLTLR